MAAPEPGAADDQRFETVVREYRTSREYERDVRARRREGWRVVSVLQRPGQSGALRRVAIGSGLARTETEYLVTYHRAPAPTPQPRPLEWLRHPHLPPLPHLPRSRSAAWIWLLVGLALLLLLLFGFADFFADAVPF